MAKSIFCLHPLFPSIYLQFYGQKQTYFYIAVSSFSSIFFLEFAHKFLIITKYLVFRIFSSIFKTILLNHYFYIQIVSPSYKNLRTIIYYCEKIILHTHYSLNPVIVPAVSPLLTLPMLSLL